MLAYTDIDSSYDGNGEYAFDSHENDDLALRAGKTLCDAQVTLVKEGDLDRHLSLNLLLCVDRTLAQPSPPEVFDEVRGTGFYSIGASESTGGRLVVTGGSYSTLAEDPERIIVVSAKSGDLRGETYILTFNTITGCAISGRWAFAESPDVLMALKNGITNCTDPACQVP